MYEQGISTLNELRCMKLERSAIYKGQKSFIRCITYKVSFKVSVRSEGPHIIQDNRITRIIFSEYRQTNFDLV